VPGGGDRGGGYMRSVYIIRRPLHLAVGIRADQGEGDISGMNVVCFKMMDISGTDFFLISFSYLPF
jgi:hypothetical protein